MTESKAVRKLFIDEPHLLRHGLLVNPEPDAGRELLAVLLAGSG